MRILQFTHNVYNLKILSVYNAVLVNGINEVLDADPDKRYPIFKLFVNDTIKDLLRYSFQ